jgi:hypothetical protein
MGEGMHASRKRAAWLCRGPLLLTGALGLALLCGACDEDRPAEPAEAPQVAQQHAAEEAALARAEAAATELGRTLKQRLSAAMAEGGPPAAMAVCADEAQALTRQVGDRTNTSVGRSSLNLRNPKNEGPEWVREWLVAHGDRPATEARPVARVTDGRAQVVRPIATEGMCLTCHGPPASIPPAVQTLLRERYPDDAATGFQEGDLRGALWAQARVASEN